MFMKGGAVEGKVVISFGRALNMTENSYVIHKHTHTVVYQNYIVENLQLNKKLFCLSFKFLYML